MRIVTGKTTEPLDEAWLAGWLSGFDGVLVDVGTGDGRFPLAEARAHPGLACIGLDAAADNMAANAARARRKPAKGGAPNALFLMAAAETLPGPLAGLATCLTVNFPWGALLRGLVAPEPDLLGRLAATCRPGAETVFLLNFSVFRDPGYVDRLALEPLTLARARDELVPAYRAAGIAIGEVAMVDPDAVPFATSWGRRLVKGSGRETVLLRGTAGDPAGPDQSSRSG